MIAQLMDLMRSETDLFRRALALEEKKRDAILAARGRDLAELNGQSEKIALEIESCERERQRLAASYLSPGTPGANPVPVNLSSLEERIRLKDPRLLASFQKLSIDYRSAAASLKNSVDNNQAILKSTSKNIATMFQEIRRLADSSMGKVYKPADPSAPGASGKDRHKPGQSMLLNANA